MRTTLAAVNKALAAAGIDAELVKGRGYFYFVGSDMDYAEEQGVYGVFRLSDLSVTQWVEEARSKLRK
ncbi:hypothetical protein PSV3_00171 [Septimatrevirus PSV32]|jgi:hypothetical protein|nr:hypothetical protein KAK25_00041 [Pseudomonas phage vB_Pae-Kakheti25]YP_010598093.1 hypothetical protein PM408_gp09 [Pseudomonas phage PSV3]YP_010598238.1 hypothetical protein PM409_gp68 [Pseudomonas phage PSV3]AFB83329.1 hypothetical protein KAK25_00041 [Pseudomonas phage vB_Pae-Kakheti25]WBF76711.1 hypothetical protein PSV3_00009 [Pseudomonas phage PSV3]WBF76873.1 hypothetical protein PSV3_00171 [Pseudomonas phage PSV3]